MHWARGPPIGRGSSGTIHLGHCRNNNYPVEFAVKSCPLSSSSIIQHEEFILSDLQSCPQVISCYGHDITPDRNYNLFLEYADGGSISDAIRRSGGSLPEPVVRHYLRSVLLGLCRIHSIGYVHCDIKPQNILISAGEAKIADFGLSRKASETSAEEIRGTPAYMPPESVAGKGYDAAGDIWALGCTIAEMVSGHPPWQRESGNGVWPLLMRIGSGDDLPEIPQEMSDLGKDFLFRCFQKDPKNRWTAEMLLSHPFVGPFSESESGEKDGECSVSYKTPKSVLESFFVSTMPSTSPVEETRMADSFELEFGDDWGKERVRELATVEWPEWAGSSLEVGGWIAARDEG